MKFVYAITRELLQSMMDIASLEKELNGLSLTPALRTSLYQSAKMHTSHYSNKIEGNCLTLEQTEAVWKKKRVEAPKRDIQEIKNLFDLFDYLIERSQTSAPLTEEMILDIHRHVEKKIVKGGLLGKYRESQNAIFDAATNQIIYMPPEAADVRKLMNEFLDDLNNTQWEHDLIKAAVAHAGLVSIHPFMDGNGRTARALSTFTMMQSGYSFVRYMAWDEYFYQHRARYYEILHEMQGSHFYDRDNQWNIQQWLDFFIGGVLHMIRHFLGQIRSLPIVRTTNSRQEKALRFLKRKGRLTNRDYRELNKVSNYTALMDLRAMEEQSLIKKIGKGRSVTYILNN